MHNRVRPAVTVFAALILALTTANSAVAQRVGSGASVTPYAGYLVTGNWYDGPIGTSLSTSNAPMLGAQATIPIAPGFALVGNLAYASGDLRIGLPIIGGVNIGSAKTWLYDAGLELGGLTGSRVGIAPFLQGGVGGMTNNIKHSLFSTNETNLVYTAGVGLDLGVSKAFAVRVQAKDWIGRFNSADAVGFHVKGNLAHNWALTGGVKLAF